MPKELSVIIAVWDMAREAPRTLASFLPPYQTLGPDEIIVVDNGSPTPLALPAQSPCVRYIYLDDAPASPGHAVNVGVDVARGRYVCIVIDGARLVSPGLVRAGLEVCRIFPNPLVSSVAFHLGPEPQQISTLKGYGTAAEDALLAGIGWPSDGYRLFEIACFATSNRSGWFSDFTESNCLFLRRDVFHALGGMDERFALPGGGLVNLDFFRRESTREIDTCARCHLITAGHARPGRVTDEPLKSRAVRTMPGRP
jgi:glycosyltransferase involved in cell wall biosynthesis